MFEKLKMLRAADKTVARMATIVATKTGVLGFNDKALKQLMGAVVATGTTESDARYHQLAVNLLGEKARDFAYDEVKKRILRVPHLRVLDAIGVLPLLHQILVEDERSMSQGYLARDVNAGLTSFLEESLPSLAEDVRSLLSMAGWVSTLRSAPMRALF